jgi:hypothetical protein
VYWIHVVYNVVGLLWPRSGMFGLHKTVGISGLDELLFELNIWNPATLSYLVSSQSVNTDTVCQ